MTFGIAEKSTALIAAIFDDKDGSKMKKLAKLIKGKPEPMENHIAVVNTKVIFKFIFFLENVSFSLTFSGKVMIFDEIF